MLWDTTDEETRSLYNAVIKYGDTKEMSKAMSPLDPMVMKVHIEEMVFELRHEKATLP